MSTGQKIPPRGGGVVGLLVESFQLLEVFAGGVDVFVNESLEALIGLAHLSSEGAEAVSDSAH